jgi:hypothetical protein
MTLHQSRTIQHVAMVAAAIGLIFALIDPAAAQGYKGPKGRVLGCQDYQQLLDYQRSLVEQASGAKRARLEARLNKLVSAQQRCRQREAMEEYRMEQRRRIEFETGVAMGIALDILGAAIEYRRLHFGPTGPQPPHGPGRPVGPSSVRPGGTTGGGGMCPGGVCGR